MGKELKLHSVYVVLRIRIFLTMLALIPALGWKRQEELSEYEASLAYRASSRTTRFPQ